MAPGSGFFNKFAIRGSSIFTVWIFSEISSNLSFHLFFILRLTSAFIILFDSRVLWLFKYSCRPSFLNKRSSFFFPGKKVPRVHVPEKLSKSSTVTFSWPFFSSTSVYNRNYSLFFFLSIIFKYKKLKTQRRQQGFTWPINVLGVLFYNFFCEFSSYNVKLTKISDSFQSKIFSVTLAQPFWNLYQKTTT